MSDAQAKAEHAKQLLADPVLSEVMDAIEAAAINAWRSTSTMQTQERDIAWYSLKAAERVRTTLQSMVDNGLIEANRAARQR